MIREPEYMPPAVANAYDVIGLWEENLRLREKVRRGEKYEKMYHELLSESVEDGHKMIGNWLQLVLSDRIKFDTQPQSE